MEPASIRSRYRNDFVAAESLPPEFFDPASTGYVERDPEQPLRERDAGITVYWLGREYAGSEDLPALALRSVYLPDEGRSPGYWVLMDYNLDTEFGPPALEVQEWDRREWDHAFEEHGHLWWESPCVEKEELTLAGGTAVVYMSFEEPAYAPGEDEVFCPDRAFDKFGAQVALGSTVIVVSPLTSSEGENPYSSLRGLKVIAGQLRPRE